MTETKERYKWLIIDGIQVRAPVEEPSDAASNVGEHGDVVTIQPLEPDVIATIDPEGQNLLVVAARVVWVAMASPIALQVARFFTAVLWATVN